MKKYLLFLLTVLFSMVGTVSSFAIDKVVKKTAMTGEITSVDGLTDAMFLLQNEDGQLLCTPSGWDIKVTTVTDFISSKDKGGYYKLEAFGDHWLIPVFNGDGNRRTFWAGNQYVNSQPVGGNVIFGLSGTNDQHGQDGPDLAVWDITYEAGKGFAFHCVGRDIYIGYDKDAARPVSSITYWRAYTGIDAVYDEAEVNAAKAAVLAEAKNSDVVAAINSAADIDALAAAVNTAIDDINASNAILAADDLDDAGKAVAAEVKAKYNAGEYKNANELRVAMIAAYKAQATAGANMTGAIINPSFELGTLDGWTSQDGGAIALNYNFGKRTGDKFVERWTPASGKLSDGILSQTITGLPNGEYKLTAEMQNIEQGNGDAPGTGYYLVANEDRTAVAVHGETVVVNTTVTDGTLTIAAQMDGCSGNWICVDNFQLTLVEPSQPAAEGWDGETVTTSLDGEVLANADAIEGLTLTFKGAKSIEVDEEGGYLALVADEDGSEILKIWGAMFGGEAEIDGATVTLTNWINLEDIDMGGATPYAEAVKKARKIRKAAVAEDSWYIQDFGAFIIDGKSVYLDDIAVAHEDVFVPDPFYPTSVSNNGVDGSIMSAVEASEDGVSKTFVMTATGKTLAKGTAEATLSMLEAETEFGAATVTITENGAEISFNEAGKDVFTAAGTYVLSIPEGVVVDEEGNPNAAMAIRWVIIETEPQPIFADGDYLIMNAGGGYLGGGNDWGTHASLLGKPQWFTVTMTDGKYTLDSHQSNGGNNHFLASGLYVDGAAYAWTITPLDEDGTIFTISNDEGKYLASNGMNNTLELKNEADIEVPKLPMLWAFVPMSKILEDMELASQDDAVDVTALIKNPELKRNAGYWTNKSYDGSENPKNFANGQNANKANLAESYHSANGFKTTQTITLPKAGVYALTAQAFYRVDGALGDQELPYLFAGEQKSEFPIMSNGENSMPQAYANFLKKMYPVDPIYIQAEAGQEVEIGFAGNATNLWNIFGELTLSYYGAEANIDDIKNADLIAQYNELVEKANELLEEKMSAAIREILSGEAAKEQPTTAEDLEEAIDQLNQLNAAAAKSIADYKKIGEYAVIFHDNLAAIAPEIDPQDQQFLEDYEAGTLSADVLESGVTPYETKYNEFISAIKNDEGNLPELKVVDDAIVNPDFEVNGVEGWTTPEGWANSNPWLHPATNNFPEKTNTTFLEGWVAGPATHGDETLSQEITLPAGVYMLTVDGKLLQQGDPTVVPEGFKLFAGDKEATITDKVGTYALSFTLEEEGTINIGAKFEDATGNWGCIDNFVLYFIESYSEPVEIQGTPFDISYTGQEIPEDAIKTYSFSGQWQSMKANPGDLNPETDSKLVIEFAEPLENTNWNFGYNDAAGVIVWNYCGDDDKTGWTVAEVDVTAAMNGFFIQNTAGSNSLSIVKSYIVKNDDSEVPVTWVPDGWGPSVGAAGITSGEATITAQWDGVHMTAPEAFLQDGTKTLRIYTNNDMTGLPFQWCLTDAEGNASYPAIGVDETGKYAEFTTDLNIKSLYLQHTTTEASTLDIVAITWEFTPAAKPVEMATITIEEGETEEGNKAIIVKSTNDTYAIHSAFRPYTWLEEDETPESIVTAIVDQMQGAFANAQEFEDYYASMADKGTKEYDVEGMEEMYAGEKWFVAAVNLAWDETVGGVVLASNVEVYDYEVPAAPVEDCALTASLFHEWDSYEANGNIVGNGNCEEHWGESSGLPYGNGSVIGAQYADVSDWACLKLTVTEGTPRILLNRQDMGGSSSDFIEINSDDNPYVAVIDGVWYIDIAKIVEDKGYAHINCIKGANWQNTTITEAMLLTEMPAEAVGVNSIATSNVKDGKFLQNGKVVIVKNGQKFNAAGARILK